MCGEDFEQTLINLNITQLLWIQIEYYSSNMN